MPLSIEKLIARTQAAIDGETDPRKLRALQASLAAHLATKAEMEDSDEGDDDEDSKAKKAAAAAAKAKGKAEAAKHRAKAAEHKAKAAEAEEEAKKCESAGEEDEDEESEEAAALAAPTHDALLAKLAASVSKIEKTQIASTKAALISGARKLGAITKTEATWLDGQGLSAVESFLEMRSKAGLVATSEEALIKPKDAKPGTEESLPAETLQMIEAAVNVWTGDKAAYRKVLVDSHLAAHEKQVKAALNGAPGRY